MWDNIIKVWNDLFKGHQEEEVKKPYKNSPPEIKLKARKIAIVVGHEATRKGMKLYTGEYEYDWNSKIAAKLIKAYKGPHELKLFFRDHIGVAGVATQASGWGAEMLLELHLNAAGIPAARGCEAVVLDDDKRSHDAGKKLIQMLSQTMGVKIRRGDGLLKLKKGDRGFPNLLAYKEAGIQYQIILEPFFADFKSDESEFFIKNPDLYIDCLCHFLNG